MNRGYTRSVLYQGLISENELCAHELNVGDLLRTILRIVSLRNVHRLKVNYRSRGAYYLTAYYGEVCGINVVILFI